ncbi:MAG: S-layer homology domain-containing protein [Acidobacteria bacterium]|nr:S-layer homology domain-containing protein [Acidobacteriota bacterium]
MKNKGTARMRLGRLLTALSIAGVLIVPSSALASEDLETVTFNGAGWGHGVGLSQYGALGAAQDGWSYDQITAYFYSGSAVGVLGENGLPGPQNLWVNLEKDKSSIELIARSTGFGTDVDVVVTRESDQWILSKDQRIALDYADGACDLVIRDTDGTVIDDAGTGSCVVDIDWDGFVAAPTRKIAIVDCYNTDWNTVPSMSRECQYGRGQLHLRSGPGGMDLSLEIDINDYIRGISEMPYFWGLTNMYPKTDGGIEALKAQAVAARSYAFELMLFREANDGPPGNNACGAWCHVRDSTIDQRYVGWGHVGFGITEWLVAVDSTKSVVITHPDAPTQTIVRGYYSSSSGGATENIDEVWSSWSARPYYQSVDSSWDVDDAANPHSSWEREFTGNYVAGKVGLDTVTAVVVTAVNSSGSANTVVFTGVKNGGAITVTKTSSSVKSLFGLRSIYFRANEPYAGAAPAPTFTDTAGSVHEANIEWIAAQGITFGCNPPDNTNFCPGESVTRGQMAAFLNRALDLPPATTDHFNDDNTSIFESDINALAKAGITMGCGESSFCPQDTVTRGQMAAFLARAFNLQTASTDYFNDDDTSIFETDINRIRLVGITVGCNPPTNNQFCPDDPVTRAQLATFLHRAIDG